MRVFLYIRVSKIGDREDTLISDDVQEDVCRRWAAREQIVIVGEPITDLDKTGREDSKRQIAKTIDRVRRGEADGVLVWKISRWGRNTLDSLVNVNALHEAGGFVASATENIDDVETPFGKFSLTQMLSIAQLQSDQIGETWVNIHDYRRGRGLPHNGGPRFGYVKNDDVGRDDDPSLVYTVDLRTGPWLRQCYEQYVAGKTITKLVFELNENGIVTTSGGRFTFRTLQKVLDSGFGAGLIIDRRGVDPNTDNPNLVEYYQGAHEAVIDEQTWEAYVRRRATKVPPRAAATATKLSGRLYCVSCRRRMRIYWSSKSRHKSRHRGFECGRDKHSNQTSILCPAPVSIRQTVVEAGVYNWLREKERGLGEFERALERQRRREQAHADADAIDVEIARLARRRQRLLDVFLVDDDETEGDASGPDSNDLKAEYLAKRAEFDAEIEALTAKADELRAEDVGPLIPSQDIFMNLLTMYDRADVGMMSEALGAVVQRIYVHREDTDRTDLLDRLEVIAAWEEDPYAMLPA